MINQSTCLDYLEPDICSSCLLASPLPPTYLIPTISFPNVFLKLNIHQFKT